MKRKSNRGQILPLFLVLLSTIFLFLTANFERSRLGIAKIERQKAADALVLRIVNEQTRALNGIAALNEGLSLILHRAYIYAAALATTFGCSAATVFNPMNPCTRAFRSLSKNAKPFFEGVNRLGTLIGNWQDELKAYANRTPNVLLKSYPLLFLDPSLPTLLNSRNPTFQLLIQRATLDAFRSKGSTPEEAGMAGGGDVQRCQTSKYGRSQFETFKARARQKSDADIVIASYMKQNHELVTRSTVSDTAIFWERGIQFTFLSGILKRCYRLSDILKKQFGGTLLPVKVPPPYVLKANFFNDQTLTLKLKRHSIKEGLSETYTESQILGGDLGKMEFSSRLKSVEGVQNVSLIH